MGGLKRHSLKAAPDRPAFSDAGWILRGLDIPVEESLDDRARSVVQGKHSVRAIHHGAREFDKIVVVGPQGRRCFGIELDDSGWRRVGAGSKL